MRRTKDFIVNAAHATVAAGVSYGLEATAGTVLRAAITTACPAATGPILAITAAGTFSAISTTIVAVASKGAVAFFKPTAQTIETPCKVTEKQGGWLEVDNERARKVKVAEENWLDIADEKKTKRKSKRLKFRSKEPRL